MGLLNCLSRGPEASLSGGVRRVSSRPSVQLDQAGSGLGRIFQAPASTPASTFTNSVIDLLTHRQRFSHRR
jgi:hypothetical protein